jgi:outer membrane protein
MLKIITQEERSLTRLTLAGKLTGPWVAELDKAWRSAQQTPNKPIAVDLRDVIFVDDAGKQLLTEMLRSGAHFITSGVMMNSLVKEMARTLAVELNHRARSGVRHAAGVVFLLLALAANNSNAQQPAAPVRLTLKEAVQIALKQNPQVAIANLSRVESHEAGIAALAELLPQVSFRASDTLQRENIQALLGRRIPGFPGHIGPYWAINAGPQFSMPLFDLTAWRRWQAARETERTATAYQTTARELNAQLVVSQYLGSLRAAAEVKEAQSRVTLAIALRDLAADLQKNGAGLAIDTLRANVQYQNEKQRLIVAETQLKTSLYGLTMLLNLDPQTEIRLADESSFFDTPAFPAEQSLASAYSGRPEMQAIDSSLRTAELQKSAVASERLPRLSLTGAWGLQGVTPDSMIPAYEYGATLTMPLFTSGKIHAATTEASIEIKKLEQSKKELRNRIALEVKTALAQIEAARSEVDAANLGVALATESTSQAQDRFRVGVANNIEVITAQDELARANDNQIAALYRYNQSRADLAHATGQMQTLYAK